MAKALTRDQLILDYNEKNEELLLEFGNPVSQREFLRELFPEGFLQECYSLEPPTGNPAARKNGMYIARAVVTYQKGRRTYKKVRAVTNDLHQVRYWYRRVAYLAPCSFWGGAKDTAHLRYMHALVVDLDDVRPSNLRDWLHWLRHDWVPKPTLVVNSGTGLHLYYVLDEPFRAWPKLQPALKALKDALCDINWNGYTSQNPSRQYSGLVQPYRIPGTRTKLDMVPGTQLVMTARESDYPVTAFRSGEKWPLDALLAWRPTPFENQPDYVNPWVERAESIARMLHPELDPEHVTLDKAREMWPEWYLERIVRGEPRRPTEEAKWHVAPAVYEWWLRKIQEPGNAEVGHRYYCVMMLAIYARKCDVPFGRLKSDAFSLLQQLDDKTIEETNHFHRSDIDDALKAYWSIESVKMPVGLIDHLSGVRIERNRRNGRSQEQHLRVARAIQTALDPNEEWRNINGAPAKSVLVRSYAAEHPEANHSQIARALGVSRTTVVKWLKDYAG